jgi:hypothetical protein
MMIPVCEMIGGRAPDDFTGSSHEQKSGNGFRQKAGKKNASYQYEAEYFMLFIIGFEYRHF